MRPPLDPDCARATDPALTRYDEEHLITNLRMLDAIARGLNDQAPTLPP
jgi:hypothetical protein